MNVEDMVLIEKIERLAYQAGASGVKQKEEAKPEHPFIAKLRAFALAHATFSGTAIYHTNGNPADNIEWSELIAFARQK